MLELSKLLEGACDMGPFTIHCKECGSHDLSVTKLQELLVLHKQLVLGEERLRREIADRVSNISLAW